VDQAGSLRESQGAAIPECWQLEIAYDESPLRLYFRCPACRNRTPIQQVQFGHSEPIPGKGRRMRMAQWEEGEDAENVLAFGEDGESIEGPCRLYYKCPNCGLEIPFAGEWGEWSRECIDS